MKNCSPDFLNIYIFKDSSNFIFQKCIFGRYQRLVENYSVSCVQITKEGIDN